MLASTASRRSRWGGWPVPVAAAVVLVAVAVVTVVIASQAGGADAPSAPGQFQAPRAGKPTKAFDVEVANGGVLRVSGGAGGGGSELRIPAGAPVDILEAATVADAKPGDRVVVIGIANEVRNASIHLIVLLGPGAVDAGAPPTGAAGFTGHEASRDGHDVPTWWGTIESVEGQVLKLRNGNEIASLEVAATTALRRVRAAEPSAIASSDRIALHLTPTGAPDPAAGVLVLAGGAR